MSTGAIIATIITGVLFASAILIGPIETLIGALCVIFFMLIWVFIYHAFEG